MTSIPGLNEVLSSVNAQVGGYVSSQQIDAMVKTGQPIKGDSFTVANPSKVPGNYVITFEKAFSGIPACVINPITPGGINYLVNLRTDQTLSASEISFQIAGLDNNNYNAGFTFVASASATGANA